MIRNTSTIIVLTLFLSACCEKEGSFLNAVIKNHTAKLAAAAQQEAIISQQSSTLNANAAAIPVESTLTPLLKSNKENTLSKEAETLTTEKIVTKTDDRQKESSNEEIGEQVSEVATDADNIELKATQSIDILNQQQAIAKLETSDIDVSSQYQLPTNSEAVEIEVENSAVNTNINQEIPPIQLEEVIEQIVDQSPSLNEDLSNDHQNVIAAIENSEQKNIQVKQLLTNEGNETKTPTDDKKNQLSELISLLNKEDNSAIDDIIGQAKAKTQSSGDESEFDRNKRLLELLSKDIKQQSQNPNSKISQQSLELLNDMLSD